MRHISSLLYDARRIVSLTSELPLLLLVAMSALMVQAMYDVGSIVGAAVAGAGVCCCCRNARLAGCKRRRRCWLECGRSQGGALDVGEKEGTAPGRRI